MDCAGAIAVLLGVSVGLMVAGCLLVMLADEIVRWLDG